MRWWTSDLHLGHANICAYTGRPYRSVDEMDSDLIERWNARVDPADEVIVLGDVAMGRISESLALVRSLAGRKVLVPGNHDRCWEGLRRNGKGRVDEWLEEYRRVGFTVRPGPVEFDLGGMTVLADHFPYHGDSQAEERYREWRPADHGSWLLHGHVHDKWRQSGRMINVGVDAWGGYPVAEADLLQLVEDGPAERNRLAWLR